MAAACWRETEWEWPSGQGGVGLGTYIVLDCLPLSKLGLPKPGPFGLVKKLLAQLLKLEAKMTNITSSQL